MIDNRDNLNRGRNVDRGMGWGLPLGLAALALVAGLLFFNWSSYPTSTASSTPPTTQNSSSPNTSPTTPAPVPARPGMGG